MYSRNEIVNQMKKWVGCKQGDATHKKIVDIYNSHAPLARGYKLKYSDAWCAGTVSACAIACGYTAIIPTEVSCTKMIELLKSLGEWMENDNYVPKTGDIIFYDWEDNGNGDCIGQPNHVGIVYSCDGKTIDVIEGNMGNNHVCGHRIIGVNNRYIRGFGIPKYDNDDEIEVEPTTDLKIGDTVKLKDGATYWNGKKIPSWVFKSKLYYRGDNKNGAIVSILKIGAITGVVKKSDLIKV